MTRLLALIVAVAACGGRDADKAAVERCKQLGDGKLRGGGVSVHLANGKVPACGDHAGATAGFIAVHDALAAVRAELRPSPVLVQLDGAVDAIETDRDKGMIRLAENPSKPIDRAAWLHELSHLASLGPRPKGIVGGRLADALDEGVADYYAAMALQSPELGPRDISAAPRDAGAAWTALPMPAARFDPHPLGHAFAAALWKRRVAVQDLLVCMTAPNGWGDTDAPRAVLGAWLAGCPTRSRGSIREALADWTPPQLLPEESRIED